MAAPRISGVPASVEPDLAFWDEPDADSSMSPERLRSLLDAVIAVSGDLDLHATLQRIVGAAARLADARYVALGVLDERGAELSDFIVYGLTDAEIAAIGPLPRGHGMLGLLIREPRPLRVRDLQEHPAAYGVPEHHPPMTTFLGVPVRVGNRVFGNLYLTDKLGGGDFTDSDERAVVALASAAAVAVDNARLFAEAKLREQERAAFAVVEDRERIARDLHDVVLQRLFATGLTLQGATRSELSAEVETRVKAAIADLDTTIREIRSTIFDLGQEGHLDLLHDIRAAIQAADPLFRSTPELELRGPVETAVPHQVRSQLLAVLREALSNAGRHAQAQRVRVTVEALSGVLMLEVRDDGVGFKIPNEPRGLRNMRDRAVALNGSCHVETHIGKGTVVRWQVPLP